ncbi:MAG: OST-HTH/LOTUS domain-containing protein, partial [Acidimicrobiales bacterium]
PVGDEPTGPATLTDVEKLLTQTLAGLERASGSVRASSLKRAVLRKSSTFSEADYGFRSFTELLRSLAERGVLEITDSASVGDPDVQLPTGESLGEEAAAFDLLASVVDRLGRGGSGTPLSGLKTQLRRTDPEFSEKRFGFGGFLQFAKAATTRGVVNMAWNDEADDYLLTPVDGRPGVATNDGVGNGAAPMLQAVPDLTPLPGPTQQHDAASDEATGSPRPQRRRGRRGRGSNIGDGAEPTPDHLSWAIPAQPAPPLDEPAGSRWPNTGSATAWADTDTDTDTDNDTAGDAGWTDADDDSDQQEDPGWTATPAAPEPAVTATATSRGFEPDQPQAAAATITDTDTDRDTDTDEPDPEPRSVRTRARRATPAAAPDATEDETQEQLVLTEAEPAPARAPKRAASPRSRSRATAGSTAAATDAQTGDPVSADPNGDAPEPKPRRRTTRKAAAPADAEGTGTAAATSESGTEGAEEAAPRRRRTRTASPKTTSGDAT